MFAVQRQAFAADERLLAMVAVLPSGRLRNRLTKHNLICLTGASRLDACPTDVVQRAELLFDFLPASSHPSLSPSGAGLSRKKSKITLYGNGFP
jgi:hypothetical protein